MQRTRTYSLSPEIGDGLLGGGGSASFRSSSSVVEAPAQDFDVPRRVKRRRLSRLPDDTLLSPPLEVIEVDDVGATSVPPPPVAAAVPAADEAPVQVIDLSNEDGDDDEAMVVGTRAGTRSRARRPPPLPSRRPPASGASRYAHDLGPGARVSFTARAVEAHGTDPMAQQERAFRRSLAMREILRSSASGAGGGGAASSSAPGAGRAPPSPFSNADFRDMLFSAMAARRSAALAGSSGSGSGIATGVATRAGGPGGGGGGGGVGLRASFGGLPLLFLFNSADPDDIFARLDELTRFRMNRGASDEQISNIPTYVVPNSKKRARSEDGDKEEAEEPMCSICLDSLDPGAEVSKLPCSHEFHTACINKWLKENKVCCLCKHDVTKPKPCDTAGGSSSAARATFI